MAPGISTARLLVQCNGNGEIGACVFPVPTTEDGGQDDKVCPSHSHPVRHNGTGICRTYYIVGGSDKRCNIVAPRGRAALLARWCMTLDPLRDMRDAVLKEPPRVSQDEGIGSWLGLAFALAMLILAAWYFWGDSMRSSMRADAPSTSPPHTKIVEHE